MSRKPKPEWWESLPPLTDEQIAWWQNELKATDQLGGVKRSFLSALNELAERRHPTPAPAVPRLWPSPRNLIAGICDQGARFLVTRTGWRIFRQRSHYRASGKPKVAHHNAADGWKTAWQMQAKHGGEFEAYRCIFCDDYHVGRNR